MQFKLKILLLAFFVHSTYAAEVSIAKKVLADAGVGTKDSVEEILRKVQAHIGTVLHRNAPREEPGPGAPPRIPKKGKHPYEWDSIRSAEQMLKDGDGGTCGTFGLSVAALLSAAGVPESEMRIVGAVNTGDLKEICPDKGKIRNLEPQNGASGHVFLLVKFSKGWHLVNTSQSPLFEPHPLSNGAARKELERLEKLCREKFPKPSPESFGCFENAFKEAKKRVTLDQIEIIPFKSPAEIESEMKNFPTDIPVQRFPSLRTWMGPGLDPEGMKIFRLWKYGTPGGNATKERDDYYPLHTFEERFNLVASGSKSSNTCRYGKKQLEDGAKSSMETNRHK